MEPVLPQDAVQQFERDGFIFPIRVMDRGDAIAVARKIGRIKESYAHLPRVDHDHKLFRFKPHLKYTCLDAIVHNARVLDAVEALIGPDILLWTSTLFIKDAHNPAYIGWHQDSYTYPLDGDEVVNVWVALTDATLENGAMRFFKGSNGLGPLDHAETWEEYHLGSRGETVDTGVNDERVVDVLLEAGQASIHHVDLIHSSQPNRSGERRIGYAIRYIPARLRDTTRRGTAMLVRGEDRYGHWELEPRPSVDYDPRVMPIYERAMGIRSDASLGDNETDRAFTEA